MSDQTSIEVVRDGVMLFAPGDAFDHVYPRAIVVRCDLTVLTYRKRIWWYDGPRLWLRALWRRARSPQTGEAR